MARQRYYRSSARCCRVRHVSADRAARPGPHTRGKPRLLDVGRRIPARDRFAPDSPLERDGFELSVPREYDPDKRGARDREFADSPLEGGVSCELVSEVKFASRASNGSIPRGLGTILGAVERLFRARTGNNRAKTQHFRHFWMSISRLSNAHARGRFPARGPK